MSTDLLGLQVECYFKASSAVGKVPKHRLLDGGYDASSRIAGTIERMHENGKYFYVRFVDNGKEYSTPVAIEPKTIHSMWRRLDRLPISRDVLISKDKGTETQPTGATATALAAVATTVCVVEPLINNAAMEPASEALTSDTTMWTVNASNAFVSSSRSNTTPSAATSSSIVMPWPASTKTGEPCSNCLRQKTRGFCNQHDTLTEDGKRIVKQRAHRYAGNPVSCPVCNHSFAHAPAMSMHIRACRVKAAEAESNLRSVQPYSKRKRRSTIIHNHSYPGRSKFYFYVYF